MGEDDLLSFVEEEQESQEEENGGLGFWNVLIVDDEAEVHTVTEMALQDFKYDELGLNFSSAYSMLGAREILDQKIPFALILMDVVMEEDDAGLQLVNYIRNTLNDKTVRIILRTGQPGDKGEAEILEYFDIAGYRNKTDMDTRLLKSIVHQQLREYARLAWYDGEVKEMKTQMETLSEVHSGCPFTQNKPCLGVQTNWDDQRKALD